MTNVRRMYRTEIPSLRRRWRWHCRRVRSCPDAAGTTPDSRSTRAASWTSIRSSADRPSARRPRVRSRLDSFASSRRSRPFADRSRRLYHYCGHDDYTATAVTACAPWAVAETTLVSSGPLLPRSLDPISLYLPKNRVLVFQKKYHCSRLDPVNRVIEILEICPLSTDVIFYF